jgi:hypothetical protein
MQNRNKDDFMAYSETAIAAIAAFLHEYGDAAGLVILDGSDDEDEDATSNRDGDDRSLLSPYGRCATEN